MRWRRLLYIGLAAAATVVVVLALLPEPLPVETAQVTRGPLFVTVDEDGETRAHDRYVVSAPVAGRVERIELHEGDGVTRDQVVARIWPLPLSAREREEQLARIAAAEALAREAQERVRRALADWEQAARERLRMEKLARDGDISL